MKLSDKDLAILSYIQRDADAPLTKTARALGMKESTVRNSLQNFLEHKLLVRQVYVNSYALGFDEHCLLLALKNNTKENRAKLERQLRSDSRSSLVLALTGAFHYLVVFCARNTADSHRVIETASKASGDGFSRKDFTARVYWKHLGVRHLRGEVPEQEPLIFSTESSRFEPKQTDIELLVRFVSADFRSLSQLADDLGTPKGNVHYRLEKMREAGVIQRSIYHLFPSAYGCESYRFLVHAPRTDSELESKIMKWAVRCENVVSIMQNIGSWDYEIRVEAKSTRAATEIAGDLTDSLGDRIEKVDVLPIAYHVKGSTFPFKAGDFTLTR